MRATPDAAAQMLGLPLQVLDSIHLKATHSGKKPLGNGIKAIGRHLLGQALALGGAEQVVVSDLEAFVKANPTFQLDGEWVCPPPRPPALFPRL